MECHVVYLGSAGLHCSNRHLLNKCSRNQRGLHLATCFVVVNELETVLFFAHLEERGIRDFFQLSIAAIISLIKNDCVLMLPADVAVVLLEVIIINVPPLELVIHLKEPLLHVFVLFRQLIENHLRNIPFSMEDKVVD